MNTEQHQVRGLDSIRFFAALWVAFSHGAAPPVFANIDHSQGLARLLGALFDTLFCGQAGVILFFIISGFCIHFPQALGRPLHIPSFYMRRILRIALPLAAAVVLMHFFAGGATGFFRLVAWTLVCEVVYYIAYPALLFAAKKTGWVRLIIAAYFVSYLVIAIASPRDALCGSLGWHLNVLVGLPSWLLGCLLAENFLKKSPAVRDRRMWLWRVGIWAASALCMALMLHAGIGLPWTLNAFALPGYFYVRAEISHCRDVPPVRIFELLGTASYSMYLTHLIALHLVFGHGISPLQAWLRWPLLLGALFAATGAFYFLVEFPSHQLARKFRAPQIPQTK
jgi:peptidoglycan/LPS O-acetylase OafA/YrhL